MATAEQIMSLIRSHTRDDREHFHTVALQIASYEARRGHRAFADDIRKAFKTAPAETKCPEAVIPEDMQDILVPRHSDVRRCQLVLCEDNRKRIERIMHEYVQQELLKQYGLSHRRKILLAGPPGTGKTMTAHVLANTLHIPLIGVQLDMILSRYMGESSAKLHRVFDFITKNRALYLFDEFDTLASERGDSNLGEMRRVLNTLLLCIEQDHSDSLWWLPPTSRKCWTEPSSAASTTASSIHSRAPWVFPNSSETPCPPSYRAISRLPPLPHGMNT